MESSKFNTKEIRQNSLDGLDLTPGSTFADIDYYNPIIIVIQVSALFHEVLTNEKEKSYRRIN